VRITEARWAPGYRVTDILGPGTPITVDDTYGFTTTVVNGGTRDSLRVSWKIIRSFAPNDTQTVSLTPNQLWLLVEEGSYRIRVIATPLDLVSDSTGGSFVRDYTVCTGQGIFGDGPSTNAVEGCGQLPIY
jgi:hypothetical protein